jgi:hypothetical protein
MRILGFGILKLEYHGPRILIFRMARWKLTHMNKDLNF